MGLFNKKKKQENNKSTTENMSEFDRDIRELLARDDIQCRQQHWREISRLVAIKLEPLPAGAGGELK